jgi:hypothetical protein
MNLSKLSFLVILICLSVSLTISAQNTQIKGFVAISGYVEDDKLNFGIGEQDLFITSQLNDDFSFLGETVFKYSPNSPTQFNVSVERIIITYNYAGNHNALIGKHHTPTHYWNDVYHHGRVFFPTIDRPLMFARQTFPIHTTGLAMMGLNLGNLKFGYNVMLGNGIGSSDVTDNDTYKSLTIAAHIKPREKLQVGLSFYNDIISAGAQDHMGNIIPEKINQQLYTGTIANFGSKFEILAEATFAQNTAESTGLVNSFTSYLYTGWRIRDKFIPYLRYDFLNYSSKEIYFHNTDQTSILFGFRYEISFLIVAKIEYQHFDTDISGTRDLLNAQIAIGF